MIKPSVDDLLKKFDSRYSLIVATSMRARQLIDGEESVYDIHKLKPVTIAVKEISEGVIEYKRPPLNQE